MRTNKERRPSLACEFSPTHVSAAYAAHPLRGKSAASVLQPGTLTPALIGNNILDRDAVRTALEKAVAALGARNPDVAVILPDACCRVALIDLDVVPERREEASALIRLRLKKSLPFDVEKARVGWQVQPVNGKISVLAAVILNAVLEEYESIVRAAGCSPGVVLPSILASLEQVDALAPTLVIKVAPTTTSIAIVNHQALVLVRVLDRAAGSCANGAQLANDIYPSLVFFEDVYGTKVQRIVATGLSDEMKAALEELTGVRVHELASPVAMTTDQGPPSVPGGVAGVKTDTGDHGKDKDAA